MGPLQKAVREGGDYWTRRLPGEAGDRSTLRGTHVANRMSFGPLWSSVGDKIRMEMCTNSANPRIWQKGD